MIFSQQNDLVSANFDLRRHKIVGSKIGDIQKEGPTQLKNIHIQGNYPPLYIRQRRTSSINPQLNLISHSIHPYYLQNEDYLLILLYTASIFMFMTQLNISTRFTLVVFE